MVMEGKSRYEENSKNSFPYNNEIICFGKREYAIKTNKTRIRTKKIDFFSKSRDSSFLSSLSETKGNMVLTIGKVPKKIIFPNIEITAYCPAKSGKNLLARIKSILYIIVTEATEIITGRE